MRITRPLLCVVVAWCLTGTASAQVVREDGVKSIAGVVGNGVGFVEWTFQSEGGEVLFASLDAFIYEQRVPHETTVTEGGGCSGDTGTGGCGGETGGCSGESGPSRLCLQVLDSANNVLCHAKRPTPPPGWQRDPRMACQLPPQPGGSQAAYRIRVMQVSMGEEEGEGIVCGQYHATGLTAGEGYPFLLNVSLRRLPASGVNIQAAIAQSLNRF